MIESFLLLRPSEELTEFIKNLNMDIEMPPRIKAINSNKKLENKTFKEKIKPCFLSTADYKSIKNLENKYKNIESEETKLKKCSTFSKDDINEKFLKIDDINWLSNLCEKINVNLHNHLLVSDICFPENEIIERNKELEKRCEKLKHQQENQMYKNMTKNVDNIRLRHPEDTIAYQVKQFNRQLIAVFQFIVSVITGFVFGFFGIEMMVGTLDFGFRLLLGIMFSLIIAIAELYFLAKQLNEV